MNIIKGDNCNIPKKSKIKLTKFTRGRFKVTYSSHRGNNLKRYKKLSVFTYLDTHTHQIKDYNYTEMKSKSNLNRSLRNTVKPLLINNFNGGTNEIFLTLTFKNSMSDVHKLTEFYDKFWRRLCNKHKELELACVYVKEMQESRKSWHIHSIIKEINNRTLFIEYGEISRLWGIGNIWINRVLSTPDIVTSDMNIEEEMATLKPSQAYPRNVNTIIDYMCKLKTKESVFPSGVKVHGRKGKLLKPIIDYMPYDEAQSTVLNNATLKKEETFLIVDTDTNNILNSIHNEYWSTQ